MSNEQDLIREACVRVGKFALRRREELGLSSMNFAQAAGVPALSVTAFEHGLGCSSLDEMGLIEKGLSWEVGAVEKVIAAVQAGRLRPERIFMEHLDGDFPL